MKRIYEMVAEEMEKSVLAVTGTRWMRCVGALTHRERERLFGMAPTLEGHCRGNSEGGLPEEPAFFLWAIQDSNL
ncbi:hypothetical protein [Nocardiopsis ganjiahuensis]|uniref:hypothetical protein n=1 Tax=Nocardiopsis ganjiahuensis TaxID=239984 RepID=UPI00034C4493|nr:hypothetical protein [Nocardiopsis ganjiahuensis]